MASLGLAGMGASSQTAHGTWEDSPSSYVLPVAFGGAAGPDLATACLLLDMPARTLIRRLCRTKHTVRSFAAPAASALIEVPWGRDWHQMAYAGRRIKAVPHGSLTLSALGVTLTSCDGYTDDLVVGRVKESFADCLIGRGDSVWLRSFQPNDC
ncbi:carboxyltransferase domain-containing protein [Paenarthrobacter aromaticivorans]|uniref:Allophanate hydrolase subunit 1 n=1 Tax=Paenarthrobacter aromaticivorans TaxID=2849150 RepID=A0ABS6I806_9MICC|nr:carboxyltransferase domain-containing protein [Paenarthrobacter sp. MMS21-TAE1-1]MBU8867749.1 allophanate hydrolase subunit 1 [Paenarthrobacter sp. MMS21-TAE1-1]